MTTSTNRIQVIFQDARELQADALEMLAQGRVRNAAEKAWGATKRATDALVLARTGEEPERTPETGAGLRRAGIPGRSRAGCPPALPILQPAGRIKPIQRWRGEAVVVGRDEVAEVARWAEGLEQVHECIAGRFRRP